MTTLADDAAHVEDLLRRFDRDQWLATLFVPEAERRAVRAVYAFDVELSRVRDLVSDPLPGEVRLQWWRDLVEGEARGGAAGNPVAAELIHAVERHALPRAALSTLIDARVQNLYDDPPPTMTDLEGRLGETHSALLRLSTLVLAGGGDAGTPDAAGHGGVALGIARLIAALPGDIARGRLDIPTELLVQGGVDREEILAGRPTPAIASVLRGLVAKARFHLANATEAVATMPVTVRPAFLALAPIEPLLLRIDRAGARVLSEPVDLPNWRRQWALWRASRTL